MVQIKIYGLEENLNPIKNSLSDVVHSCMVEAFNIPKDKRFHRFFPLKKDDFYYPCDRTEAYTIIELSIFEGRTLERKRYLLKLLFERLYLELNLDPQDIEITIFETPTYNWGIRGLPGDEITLDYKVNE